MEEKQCIQQGNRLLVELQVSMSSSGHSCEILKSPEYMINGLVVFQVKSTLVKVGKFCTRTFSHYYSLQIRVEKTLKTDNLTYAIKCSSENLSMNPMTFLTDDTTWRQIYESTNQTPSSSSSTDEHGVSIDRFSTLYLPHQYVYSGRKLPLTLPVVRSNNQTPNLDKLQFKLTLELDLKSSSSSPLATLYNDTDLTDFKMCGKDGTVHVHKNILAGYSPVLQKLVTGEWREAKEGSVNVEGTTKETLKHLKDYMYNDKLPENGLKELMVLARYYMMEDLVQKCSFKILVNLTAQNAIELSEFATKHGIRHLFLAVLKHVQSGLITVEDMELENEENN